MLLIKMKQQDLLCDGKNISDSIAYSMRVCMTCLILSSTSQYLWVKCKLVQN